MNLRMGGQLFKDVSIPVLWGTRAIVQGPGGHLSIINLSGEKATIEILADGPAPGVKFVPRVDGIAILDGDQELYVYNPTDKLVSTNTLGLLPCQIGPAEIRVGTNVFANNNIIGPGIGIAITNDGIKFGVPGLPPNLAKLIV
jgi:hypothetical protein